MNRNYTTDVAIVGGGVIGSALAYFLRKAGVDVLVIERAEVAAESSSAAAGLLSPLGALEENNAFSDVIMASRALILKLMPELETLSGASMEYRRCGSLRTASETRDVARLREQMAVWETMGWQVNWLTGDEARQQEPHLAPTIQAAVYASQEGSIKAAGVTRAYAGAARSLGARFLEHTEVTGIESAGERVLGLRTAAGETINCARLVIAAGAWSTTIGYWLHLKIPVQPARGQILALKQPATPLKHILFGEQVYLIPKPDDTIFVGATVEQVGFEKQVTAAGISWLLAGAMKLAPVLAEAPIERMWAGLRPWSADERPILGDAPGWENVILATGHSGVGFETSAISGQSLAELLTSGQTPAIIRPFGLERFTAHSS
ncbi:MAG TPA: glycine oxidase ThiO [Ktedonobacteraceae bacterium]|nr:glycine oxidase ThiO [Ktedonobacteraceae bacterium]